MTKLILRNFIAAGTFATGLLKWAELQNRQTLTILSYHRVLPLKLKNNYYNPDLVVTPESFKLQCQFLKTYFNVLPLTEAISELNSTNTKRPLAAITFDDGYKDNFRYAAPILNQHRLSAAFFVIAGLIGKNTIPWYDRLEYSSNGDARKAVAQAKNLTPEQRKIMIDQIEMKFGTSCDLIMDWSELNTLSKQGHEIGSHSATHEILTQIDDKNLEMEISGSKNILENGLNRQVRSFCYPNGDLDDRVVHAVACAGYECAVSITSGINKKWQNPYRFKRRFIHENRLMSPAGISSSLLLRLELSGLADRIFR